MPFENLTNVWLSPNRYYRGQLRKSTGYSVCTVEFDDQGEFWDPEQLESTISHIRDACEEGAGYSSKTEVIVITFIHGWMHNATPEDANLGHFIDLISRRASAEQRFADGAGRPNLFLGATLLRQRRAQRQQSISWLRCGRIDLVRLRSLAVYTL